MKKFIFFSSVLVIIFIVFVLDIFLNNIKPLKQNAIPAVINPGQAVSTLSKPSKSEQIELNKDGALGNLISKLPYGGGYFYLIYDYSKGSFILTLDKNNLTQGNSNFDAFLKTNGIQDRSWFTNLVITNQ